MGEHYHWSIHLFVCPLNIHLTNTYWNWAPIVPDPSPVRQKDLQMNRHNTGWCKVSDRDHTKCWETQARDCLVGGLGKASPRKWHLSPGLKAEMQVASGWRSLFLVSNAWFWAHTQQVLPKWGLSSEQPPSVGADPQLEIPEHEQPSPTIHYVPWLLSVPHPSKTQGHSLQLEPYSSFPTFTHTDIPTPSPSHASFPFFS